MLQGETNGKIEAPTGSVVDRGLGRTWKALEERAKDAEPQTARDSPVPARETERRPETDPSRNLSTQIGLRLRAGQLALLDAWIAQQREAELKRPEAIRRLLDRAFAADGALDEAAAETFRDSALRDSGCGEVRVTRLRKLVEELRSHGLADAASRASEIIRSIERGDSVASRPALLRSET
jgi:hypothetical protein